MFYKRDSWILLVYFELRNLSQVHVSGSLAEGDGLSRANFQEKIMCASRNMSLRKSFVIQSILLTPLSEREPIYIARCVHGDSKKDEEYERAEEERVVFEAQDEIEVAVERGQEDEDRQCSPFTF